MINRHFTGTVGALAAALALVVVAAHPARAASAADYAVREHWAIGGDGKWDYLTVDAPHRRLFVSRSTRVQVIDLGTGKLVAEIANTPGVHGIALAPDLKRGFTSNGKADSVTVFDLDTLATIAEVKISGRDPDAIVYDAPSRRVYTFNGHSNNVTVIDGASAKEIATIALPGRPEFAQSDGTGRLFVNLEDKNELAVIELSKGSVQATWPLAPCDEPTGLALDVARQRVFSVCHNKLLIVSDAGSGKRIASLPIGSHVDATAFDPATSLIFSSNGDSADVTIVHAQSADQYEPSGRLVTAAGSKTMALDPTTHLIYVPVTGPAGFEVLVAGPKK